MNGNEWRGKLRPLLLNGSALTYRGSVFLFDLELRGDLRLHFDLAESYRFFGLSDI